MSTINPETDIFGMMQVFRPMSEIRRKVIDVEYEVIESSIGDFDMEAAYRAIAAEISDAAFACGQEWLNIHIDIHEQGYDLMGEVSVAIEYKSWSNSYDGSDGDSGAEITRISISHIDMHLYDSEAVEIPQRFEAHNIETYL